MTVADRYAAIDLGGTKVRAIVAGPDGDIYGEDIRLSRAGEGLDVTIDTMVACLEAAYAEAGLQPPGSTSKRGPGPPAPRPPELRQRSASDPLLPPSMAEENMPSPGTGPCVRLP